jgi:putative spermidine/putrescine transport system permease protein
MSVALPRPRSRARWRPDASWPAGAALAAPAVALLLALVAWPLASLVVDSLSEGGIGAYGDFFGSPADREALVRTVRVSTVVTVLALVLGGSLAWALVTTRSRLARLGLWIAVLAPFWMSVVVKNYAFVLMLAQGGPVHDLLRGVGLAGEDANLLYTEGAVIAGMLYAMFPFATLPLYAAFRGFDQSLLSAAETLGATRARALCGMLVPLAARALLSTGTLVFVISLGFYVTPVVLGGSGAPFAATVIADDIFRFFDLNGARVFAVALLVLALVTVVASHLLARRLPAPPR